MRYSSCDCGSEKEQFEVWDVSGGFKYLACEDCQHISRNRTMTNDKTRKFYRTVVVFDVLSEHPTNDMDLPELAEACDSGDCVGMVYSRHQEQIPRDEVVRRSTEMGSEPGFFSLDENGDDTF
jgi:hypothetical protein